MHASLSCIAEDTSRTHAVTTSGDIVTRHRHTSRRPWLVALLALVLLALLQPALAVPQRAQITNNNQVSETCTNTLKSAGSDYIVAQIDGGMAAQTNAVISIRYNFVFTFGVGFEVNAMLLHLPVSGDGFVVNWGGETVCTTTTAGYNTVVTSDGIWIYNAGAFSTAALGVTFVCSNIRTPLLSVDATTTTATMSKVETFWVSVQPTSPDFDDPSKWTVKECAKTLSTPAVAANNIAYAKFTSGSYIQAYNLVPWEIEIGDFHSHVNQDDYVYLALPRWEDSASTACSAFDQNDNPVAIADFVHQTAQDPSWSQSRLIISFQIKTSIPDDGRLKISCTSVRAPPTALAGASATAEIWGTSPGLGTSTVGKRDATTGVALSEVFPATIAISSVEALSPTAGTRTSIRIAMPTVATPLDENDTILFTLPSNWLVNVDEASDCTATTTGGAPVSVTTTVTTTNRLELVLGEALSFTSPLTIICTHLRTPFIVQSTVLTTVYTYSGTATTGILRSNTTTIVSAISPGPLTPKPTFRAMASFPNTRSYLIVTVPAWRTPVYGGDSIVMQLPSGATTGWALNYEGQPTQCVVQKWSEDDTVAAIPATTSVSGTTITLAIQGATSSIQLRDDGFKTQFNCSNIRTPVNAQPELASGIIRSVAPGGAIRDESTDATIYEVPVPALGSNERSMTPEQTNTGYYGDVVFVLDSVNKALEASNQFVLNLPATWTINYNGQTACTAHRKQGLDWVPISTEPTVVTGQALRIFVNEGISQNTLVSITCTNIRNPVARANPMASFIFDTQDAQGYVIERTETGTCPEIVASKLGETELYGELGGGSVSGATDTMYISIDSLYTELRVGDSIKVYYPAGWQFYAVGQVQNYETKCTFQVNNVARAATTVTGSYDPNLQVTATIISTSQLPNPVVPNFTPIRLVCEHIRAPLQGLPDFTGVRVETLDSQNVLKDYSEDLVIRSVTHIFDTLRFDLTTWDDLQQVTFEGKVITYINSPANDIFNFELPSAWSWGEEPGLLELRIQHLRNKNDNTVLYEYMQNATTHGRVMNFTIQYDLAADTVIRFTGSGLATVDPSLPYTDATLRLRDPTTGFVRSSQLANVRWPQAIRGLGVTLQFDGIDWTKIQAPENMAKFKEDFLEEMMHVFANHPDGIDIREDPDIWGDEAGIAPIVIDRVEFDGRLTIEFYIHLFADPNEVPFTATFAEYNEKRERRHHEVVGIINFLNTVFNDRDPTNENGWFYSQSRYTKMMVTDRFPPRFRGVYLAPSVETFQINRAYFAHDFSGVYVEFDRPTNRAPLGELQTIGDYPPYENPSWTSCENLLTPDTIAALVDSQEEMLCQWVNSTHARFTSTYSIEGKGTQFKPTTKTGLVLRIGHTTLRAIDNYHKSCIVADCLSPPNATVAEYDLQDPPGVTPQLSVVVEYPRIYGSCMDDVLVLKAYAPVTAAGGGRLRFTWATESINPVATPYLERMLDESVVSDGLTSTVTIPNLMQNGESVFPPFDSDYVFRVMVQSWYSNTPFSSPDIYVSKKNNVFVPMMIIRSTLMPKVQSLFNEQSAEYVSLLGTPIYMHYVSDEGRLIAEARPSECVKQLPTQYIYNQEYQWTHASLPHEGGPGWQPLPLDPYTRNTANLRIRSGELQISDLDGGNVQQYLLHFSVTHKFIIPPNALPLPPGYDATDGTNTIPIFVYSRVDPTPSFVNATLSSSGAEVYIVFSSNTDSGAGLLDQYGMAQSANGEIPCNVVIQTSTLNRAGNEPSCRFVSPKLLVLTLGSLPVLEPGDEIAIVPGLKSRTADRSMAGPFERNLLLPEVVPSPIAVLSAPTSMSCRDIVLDARRSTGGYGRPLSYQWAFLPEFSYYVQDDEQVSLATHQAALSYAATFAQYTASTLTISPTAFYTTLGLDSSQTPVFAFRVTVTNWLGASSSATVSIQSTNYLVPYVSVAGPTNIATMRWKPLSIRLIVQAFESSACTSTLPLSSMFVTWSSIPELPALANSTDLRHALSLDLPAYSLQAEETYNFTATVSVYNETARTASTTVRVAVGAGELSARIVNGTEVTVSNQEFLARQNPLPEDVFYTLDGTVSYDQDTDVYPLSGTRYAWLWTCSIAPDMLQPCFETTNSWTTSQVVITRGMLYEFNATERSRPLRFTLQLTRGGTTTSTTYQDLHIFNTPVPTVSILPYTWGESVQQSLNKLSRNSIVSLAAQVTWAGVRYPVGTMSAPASNRLQLPAVTFSYEWTIEPKFVDLEHISATGTNSPFLSIPGGSLPEGQRYSIYCYVSAVTTSDSNSNFVSQAIAAKLQSQVVSKIEYYESDEEDDDSELDIKQWIYGGPRKRLVKVGLVPPVFAPQADPVSLYDPGASVVSLTTNVPPSGGSCSVSPTDGTSAITFTLSCTGFMDDLEDLPLRYQYFIEAPVETEDGKVYRLPLSTGYEVDATQEVLLPPSSQPQRIIFYISDAHGAVTTRTATVNVNNPFAISAAGAASAAAYLASQIRTLKMARQMNDRSQMYMLANVIAQTCQPSTIEGIGHAHFRALCAWGRGEAASALFHSRPRNTYAADRTVSDILVAAALSSAPPRQLNSTVRKDLQYMFDANLEALFLNHTLVEPDVIHAAFNGYSNILYATKLANTTVHDGGISYYEFFEDAEGVLPLDYPDPPRRETWAEYSYIVNELAVRINNLLRRAGRIVNGLGKGRLQIETPLVRYCLIRGTPAELADTVISFRPIVNDFDYSGTIMESIDWGATWNQYNNVTIYIPSGAVPTTTASLVDLSVLILNENVLQDIAIQPKFPQLEQMGEPTSQHNLSPQLRISFFEAGTNKTIPMTASTTSQPFFYSAPHADIPANKTLMCRYFDTTLNYWTNNGCSFYSAANETFPTIVQKMDLSPLTPYICGCDHMSTFDVGANYVEPPPALIPARSDINGIHVYAIINNPVPLIIFFVSALVFILAMIFAYIRDKTLDGLALNEMLGILGGIGRDALMLPVAHFIRSAKKDSFVKQVVAVVSMLVRNHIWFSVCFRPRLSALTSMNRLLCCFLFFFGVQAFAGFLYMTESGREGSFFMKSLITTCIVAAPTFIIANLQNHGRYNLFLCFGYNFLRNKYFEQIQNRLQDRTTNPYISYLDFAERWSQVHREINIEVMQSLFQRDVRHDPWFHRRLDFVTWRNIVYKGTVPDASVYQFILSEPYWACYNKLDRDEFSASWSNPRELAIVDHRMTFLRSLTMGLILGCGVFTIGAGTFFDESHKIGGKDWTGDWLSMVGTSVALHIGVIEPLILAVDMLIWAFFSKSCGSPFASPQYRYEVAVLTRRKLQELIIEMVWVDRKYQSELLSKTKAVEKLISGKKLERLAQGASLQEAAELGDVDPEDPRFDPSKLPDQSPFNYYLPDQKRRGDTGLAVLGNVGMSRFDEDDILAIHRAQKKIRARKRGEQVGSLKSDVDRVHSAFDKTDKKDAKAAALEAQAMSVKERQSREAQIDRQKHDLEMAKLERLHMEQARQNRMIAKLKQDHGIIVDPNPPFDEVYAFHLQPGEKIMILNNGKLINPETAIADPASAEWVRAKDGRVVARVPYIDPREYAIQKAMAQVEAKRPSIAKHLNAPERTKKHAPGKALKKSKNLARAVELNKDEKAGVDIYDMNREVRSPEEHARMLREQARAALVAAEEALKALEVTEFNASLRQDMRRSNRKALGAFGEGSDEDDDEEKEPQLTQEQIEARRRIASLVEEKQRMVNEVAQDPTLLGLHAASRSHSRRMSLGLAAHLPQDVATNMENVTIDLSAPMGQPLIVGTKKKSKISERRASILAAEALYKPK